MVARRSFSSVMLNAAGSPQPNNHTVVPVVISLAGAAYVPAGQPDPPKEDARKDEFGSRRVPNLGNRQSDI